MEMAEMIAAVSAKSNEEIKSFLVRQKDTFRIPYQQYEEDRLRQCVFAGTTNTKQFLPFDRSGARRFLPIMIHAEKAEKHILDDEAEARAYFDQLWAEAMYLYRTAENPAALMKFSKEMESQISLYREQFMQEDTLAGTIQGWLDDYREDYVCIKISGKKHWITSMENQRDMNPMKSQRLWIQKLSAGSGLALTDSEIMELRKAGRDASMM